MKNFDVKLKYNHETGLNPINHVRKMTFKYGQWLEFESKEQQYNRMLFKNDTGFKPYIGKTYKCKQDYLRILPKVFPYSQDYINYLESKYIAEHEN